MNGRINTPRPQIPELPSSNESFLSDDTSTSYKPDLKKWCITNDVTKHRSFEISGWMSIPKSVVMATALNFKHLKRIESGKPLTILNTNKKKQRPLSEKTLAYFQSQKKTSGRKKPCYELVSPGCYKYIFDDTTRRSNSLIEFSSLTKSGCNSTSSKSDSLENDIEDEAYHLENPFPYCSRSTTPFSVKDWDVIVRRDEKPLKFLLRDQPPPMTADDRLKAQKRYRMIKYRPHSSSSIASFKAMKTKVERHEESKKENRKRFPGYPPRVVRNRAKREVSTNIKRPIMTTQTSWYPISFSNAMKGNLIELACDSYGYQTIAEYIELCQTLNDGLAVLEQQLEMGDVITLKILETERRLGLLCFAIKISDDSISVPQLSYLPKEKEIIPRNRFTPALLSDDNYSKWNFSNEVSDLKPGEKLLISRNKKGYVTCKISERREEVLYFVDDPAPVYFAVCLGLGITKVQLLGCQKRCTELIEDNKKENANYYQRFNKNKKNDLCSLCNYAKLKEAASCTYPYICTHVTLCDECRRRTICKHCKAPMCRTTCPVCDVSLNQIDSSVYA